MKFIIDIPDEYVKDWVGSTPSGKKLYYPIINFNKTYHIPTGLTLEPYEERKMTLDEAIKQCDEIADYDCYNEEQMKRAKEYRQLAEWLRDYKCLLMRQTNTNVKCNNCKYEGKQNICGKYFIFS